MRLRGGDETIDPLAERGGLPFDGGDRARIRIEQNSSNLATGRTVPDGVERADLQRESHSLRRGKLHAAQRRPRALSGKSTIKALGCVQPHAGIAIKRDQKCAAVLVASVEDGYAMTSVRVVKYKMTATIRISLHENGCDAIQVNWVCEREVFGRNGNEHG